MSAVAEPAVEQLHWLLNGIHVEAMCRHPTLTAEELLARQAAVAERDAYHPRAQALQSEEVLKTLP